MDNHDEITRAMVKAGLAWESETGPDDVVFPDDGTEENIRRYDAIRFKELHERVAELELFKSDVLAAAQATVQDLKRELEEAEAVIQFFGDSATDTFEQMLNGHWTDELGHPVANNTAMLSLKVAVEKAMVFRSARAQQPEAKKEE